VGDEREFMLKLIHEQSDELGGKIDLLSRTTDGRLLALEKARLEDDRMRLSVQTLTVRVESLLESDKLQNTSLAALTAALRPSVEATASIEGQAAGKMAGTRAGKFWGLLGTVMAVVFAAAVQQCQQQIARGAFDPLPPKPVATAH
jgi:hypothetical protein